MSGGVRVSRRLEIPPDEIEYSFSTSSGPGGQHANKVATRVDLRWNVDDSRVLRDEDRRRIRARLRHRIDSAGVLRLSSDRHRSQWRNRADVTARLADLVAEALKPPKQRVATAPTRAAKERRLESKRRRGAIKRNRRVTGDD
jgi:ribosome-associated protein